MAAGSRRTAQGSARPRALAPGELSWPGLVQSMCSRIAKSLRPPFGEKLKGKKLKRILI